MMRRLYTFFFYLILPLILIRLLYKSRHNPQYRARWKERFGYFKAPTQTGAFWIHAVSVGETVAVAPLVKALQQRYPHMPIMMTCMTPTGSERIQALFGSGVFHVYLPYDYPGAIRRFLKKTKPAALILMEKELWPNLLHYTAKQQIPILLANACLPERSYRRYRRIPQLASTLLPSITVIAAQSDADASRFIALGMPAIRVTQTNSLKFDIELAEDLLSKGQVLKTDCFQNRPVLIAASTHEEEEAMILEAFTEIRKTIPELLLILVPRHKERFNTVAKLCEQQGFELVHRTADSPCTQTTDIYLGNTMGELPLLYAASDIAFVGGSLVPVGGHNPLEPAALSKPVIMGKHDLNCRHIVQVLIACGGLKQVNTVAELIEGCVAWLSHPQEQARAGKQAYQTVMTHRGALEKHLKIIEKLLLKAE